MIYYFSATGNSRYVAKQIAAATGDTAASIENFDAGRMPAPAEGGVLGIVSPTYSWGLPLPVTDFLTRLDPGKPEYCFYIGTYGTSTGGAAEFAAQALGRPFDAVFSVKMPDTWTPIFDLSDRTAVAEINAKADKEIAALVPKIAARECGNYDQAKAPFRIARIVAANYENMRKTAHFSVENACIGCGLCEKSCPTRVIEVHNGRPVWTKERCAMCLRCLHNCPRFAIRYGSRTRGHGQYKHP